MVEGNYRICSICGSMLRSENFEHHMQTQHTPEKEKARIEQKDLDRKKRLEGMQIVQCEICGIKIKKKNLKKHKRNVHEAVIVKCSICGMSMKENKLTKHKQNIHNEYSSEQLKLKLKKMPVSERNKFIKKVLGPEQNNSTDIFSKGRVVSGGGYGLGRNRKH